MNIVEMHMNLYEPLKIERFPDLFRSYVRNWYYETQRKGLRKEDFIDEDMYQKYAEFTQEPIDSVMKIVEGDASDIPTSMLKDMNLAICKAEIPYTAYKESVVIVRSNDGLQKDT